MSHTTTKIDIPLGLSPDLYDFFSVVPSNEWFDTSTLIDYVCSHGLVNKWARNKPEAQGTMRPLTDDERKANNFALIPPTTYTSIANYVATVSGSNGLTALGWTYAAPRAINGDWMRFTDFENYRHDSGCPFPTLGGGDFIYSQSSGLNLLNIGLSAGYEGTPGNTDYIRLADLTKAGEKFSDWYAGVLLYKSASEYYLATSDTTAGNGGFKVQFNQNDGNVIPPAVNGYKGYAFMANRTFKAYVTSKGSSIAVTNLRLIPITTVDVTVNVLTAGNALTVNLSVSGGNIVVTVTNMNASAVVISPKQFQRSTNASDTTATNLTVVGTVSDFTVPAGTATNPSVVTKTYKAPVVGMGGYIRLVYTFKIGNGNTSVNQTTPWITLVSTVTE